MIKTNIFFKPDTAKIIVGTLLKKNYDIDIEVLTDNCYTYYDKKYKFTSRFPGRCELLISEIYKQLGIGSADNFDDILQNVHKHFTTKRDSPSFIVGRATISVGGATISVDSKTDNLSLMQSAIREYINFIQMKSNEQKIQLVGHKLNNSLNVTSIFNTFYKNTLVTNITKISSTSLIIFLTRALFNNNEQVPIESKIDFNWYDIDLNKIQIQDISKETKVFKNDKLKIFSQSEKAYLDFINNLKDLFKIIGLVLTNSKESGYTLNIFQNNHYYDINLVSTICTAYFRYSMLKISNSEGVIHYSISLTSDIGNVVRHQSLNSQEIWIGYVNRKIIKSLEKCSDKNIYSSNFLHLFSDDADLIQICERIIYYCNSHKSLIVIS